MDTIQSLNSHILDMKALISREDISDQIKALYEDEITIYEMKKEFLMRFGE